MGIAAELRAMAEEEQGQEGEGDEAGGGELKTTKKKSMGKQVTLTLNTATRMIGTMVEFKNVVCVCVPPSYHAMGLYMDAFEQQLQPQVHEQVSIFLLHACVFVRVIYMSMRD